MAVSPFTYLGLMPAQQPRQPAKTRRGGRTVAGQWNSKQAPDIPDGDTLDFNDTDVRVAVPCVWVQRTVNLWDSSTTFRRVVETDDAGNTTGSVTTGRDDTVLMLLNRKGDIDYWVEGWVDNRQERHAWCAEIARQMLQDGHIATYRGRYGPGVEKAMAAAGTPGADRVDPDGLHLLTMSLAKIRGLRLLQSMLPPGWSTVLDGYSTYGDTELLRDCYGDAQLAYRTLPQPPWENTTLSGVPWGSQDPAGHAQTASGEVFVGEHSDLLWRVLTEPDRHGMSPMKARLGDGKTFWRSTKPMPEAHRGLEEDHLGWLALNVEIVSAAALYDETAERQLTTCLFDGVETGDRADMQQTVADMFTEALNPGVGECRWTKQQQTRIRGFIDTVEALEP